MAVVDTKDVREQKLSIALGNTKISNYNTACQCSYLKLSVTVVYAKVKWNIASKVVCFKSATKKLQFQEFIK